MCPERGATRDVSGLRSPGLRRGFPRGLDSRVLPRWLNAGPVQSASPTPVSRTDSPAWWHLSTHCAAQYGQSWRRRRSSQGKEEPNVSAFAFRRHLWAAKVHQAPAPPPAEYQSSSHEISHDEQTMSENKLLSLTCSMYFKFIIICVP